MSDERSTLTIEDLARAADMSVRTIRYYVAEGLVPGPGSRGKGASYGVEHLSRLLLIRRLTERHVPLAEIRRLVEDLSPEETDALLRDEERRRATLSSETAATSPRAYISELLDRARAARSVETGERFRSPPQSPYSTSRTQPSGALSLGEWERLELAPGLELHARAPLDARSRRLVERLVQVAREELSRDTSGESS